MYRMYINRERERESESDGSGSGAGDGAGDGDGDGVGDETETKRTRELTSVRLGHVSTTYKAEVARSTVGRVSVSCSQPHVKVFTIHRLITVHRVVATRRVY